MHAILDRPTSRRRAAGVLLLAAAAVTAVGADAPPDDLPVRKVVLFSSGVGYFEHGGAIDGAVAKELRFKTAQINDVLKSLVVEDHGGRIGSVAYPSNDPIAKILGSFQVDIGANPSLGDLLNQLRGARVTATVGNEAITGTILGLEKHRRQVGPEGREIIEAWRLNLISGAAIRSLELDEVRNLDLEDQHLQAELGKALAALAQARDQDKKPVVVSFVGQGKRDVHLGYVVETPVWKTSYRLILPAEATAKPSLQGWALVENQTDNDWNGVALTLVSGRPISFVQDLYQPLYLKRPVVVPELYASLRPQSYEDAARTESKQGGAFGATAQLDGRTATRQWRSAAKAMNAPARPADAADEVSREREIAVTAMPAIMDATDGVASVADAAKVGEFFQYTVADVSLARQRSAMLPIIVDAIEVERVSIYNQSVLAKNPLLGARLKNTTGKHLLQGPITVLDAGSYAGDARIDDVPPGQERLLSFAIDQQVRVGAEGRHDEQAVLGGSLSQGVLTVRRRLVSKQGYAIDNRADAERTIVVEHPLRPGWKLVDSPAPKETTDALYRFQDTVAAGTAKTLTITEEFVQSETYAVADFDTPTLESYSTTGEMPKAVREALAKAAQQRRAIDELSRGIDTRTRALNDITAEQGRIRQNMQTVRQQSDYYNRLLTKLNEQETLIEKQHGEIEHLTEERDRKLAELRAYLSTLTL